ncbi:MAG: hypothetical protein O3C65_14310 [Proteobacteria bacterium]|nr:hypothetical protein [Pseudomonadota bacterium]MDA1059847.1 hypothetical protein [Pseudomonadota bacterium]
MSMSKKVAAAVVGMGVLVSAQTANAATSAGLTLTGSVQSILAVTVTPTASATGLDLTALVSQLKIATVKAESNNVTGYVVSLSSGNQTGGNCPTSTGPCFYSPVSAGAKLGFSVLRDSVGVSFSGATGTFINKTARSIVGGDNYDAKVSYDGSGANLPQATNYSETLTFTIANQ